MEHNVALEVLKLLNDEIRGRTKTNLVRAAPSVEMLENSSEIPQ